MSLEAESVLEWMERLDCGWRSDAAEAKPCVHCGKPCNGRTRMGETAVCYTCFHNYRQCSTMSGMMCGRPPGYTTEIATADFKNRRGVFSHLRK